MKTRISLAVAPVAGLAALLLMAGCSSHSASQYVSPRVEGRVLDGETRQPVANVQVRRLEPGQEAPGNDLVHGGEAMQRTPRVRSQPDGSFVLASERGLAPLRKLHWYSVGLVFEHGGYEPFTATYVPANATNTAAGEPVVFAGDILLRPVTR